MGKTFGILSYTDVPVLLSMQEDILDYERGLASFGYFDIAFKLRKLRALCFVAEKQIYESFEELKPIFIGIEKYDSNDINKKELIDLLENFRKDNKK